MVLITGLLATHVSAQVKAVLKTQVGKASACPENSNKYVIVDWNNLGMLTHQFVTQFVQLPVGSGWRIGLVKRVLFRVLLGVIHFVVMILSRN